MNILLIVKAPQSHPFMQLFSLHFQKLAKFLVEATRKSQELRSGIGTHILEFEAHADGYLLIDAQPFEQKTSSF